MVRLLTPHLPRQWRFWSPDTYSHLRRGKYFIHGRRISKFLEVLKFSLQSHLADSATNDRTVGNKNPRNKWAVFAKCIQITIKTCYVTLILLIYCDTYGKKSLWNSGSFDDGVLVHVKYENLLFISFVKITRSGNYNYSGSPRSSDLEYPGAISRVGITSVNKMSVSCETGQ